VGLLLWALRAGDMDQFLHGASAAGTTTLYPQQHGGRQQMRAVSCLYPQEAEHRLALYGVMLLNVKAVND